MATIKRQLRRYQALGLDDAVADSTELMRQSTTGADFKEGWGPTSRAAPRVRSPRGGHPFPVDGRRGAQPGPVIARRAARWRWNAAAPSLVMR